MDDTSYENKALNEKDVVVLGVPFDSNSSFRRGPALAPVRIREALFTESSNRWTENAFDLGATAGWHIWPDIEFADEKKAFAQIESEIDKLIKRKAQLIVLGGITPSPCLSFAPTPKHTRS